MAERSHSLADTADETAETMQDVRGRADELASRTADLQRRLATFETRDVDDATDHGMSGMNATAANAGGDDD